MLIVAFIQFFITEPLIIANERLAFHSKLLFISNVVWRRFCSGKEYNKEIFDELIRVPDYISGAIASMDFDDVDKIPEKHYKLFDKSIVDNERICIMGLEHHQSEDILGEIKFTRHSPLSQ